MLCGANIDNVKKLSHCPICSVAHLIACRAGMTKENRLNQKQFTFKITKDNALFVYWNGKHVRTYTGSKAASILEEIEGAESDLDIQYSLARVTGNFKRGNERVGKAKS